MDNFKNKIYKLTSQIPPGKVATYGQLAKLAGHSGAARAVGQFMKNNPDPKNIPCHRVVASDGSLTGYAFSQGIAAKKEILQNEGVIFNGDKVDLTRSLL
jgi:O-6-methylguanine DNA methyltransferase